MSRTSWFVRACLLVIMLWCIPKFILNVVNDTVAIISTNPPNRPPNRSKRKTSSSSSLSLLHRPSLYNALHNETLLASIGSSTIEKVPYNASIKDYYQQSIFYIRRVVAHVSPVLHKTQWSSSVPLEHSKSLLHSFSVFAVGDHPLRDPLSLTIGGNSYWLKYVGGYEDCYDKRLNFFAHYSVVFPQHIRVNKIRKVLMTRQQPLYIIDAHAVTSTGRVITLFKNVELSGNSTLPESCIPPPLPNLKTRNAVLRSMYSYASEDDVANLGTTVPLTIPQDKDCVIVTAVLGDYESCLHSVFPQQPSSKSSSYERRCLAIAFTDQPALQVHPDWTVIRTPYHYNDIRQRAGSDMSRGKYYKMQAYKFLPTHVRYLLWLDATMEVLNATIVESWFDMLQQGGSDGEEEWSPLITAPHMTRQYLLGEACISFNKYMSEYPNIIGDYLEAVQDGYCEEYWSTGTVSPTNIQDLTLVTTGALCGDPSLSTFHPLRYGYHVAQTVLGRNPTCKRKQKGRHLHSVYITCVVLMDLYAETVRDFLDYWYESTMRHQQDQVSFSLGTWRYGLIPGSIGFNPLKSNPVVRKHEHGPKGCPQPHSQT
eukprot:PhF_6_TR15649/c0_g1_i1/m.24318